MSYSSTNCMNLVMISLNAFLSSLESFFTASLLSTVKTLWRRKLLFTGNGSLRYLFSKIKLISSLFHWRLVICISRISPVRFIFLPESTKAGLRLIPMPSEKGKSMLIMSRCSTSLPYFKSSSQRASSLLSQSLASEDSLMAASSNAFFLTLFSGATLISLLDCKSLRNALPSGLCSLMVRMYSALRWSLNTVLRPTNIMKLLAALKFMNLTPYFLAESPETSRACLLPQRKVYVKYRLPKGTIRSKI